LTQSSKSLSMQIRRYTTHGLIIRKLSFPGHVETVSDFLNWYRQTEGDKSIQSEIFAHYIALACNKKMLRRVEHWATVGILFNLFKFEEDVVAGWFDGNEAKGFAGYFRHRGRGDGELAARILELSVSPNLMKLIMKHSPTPARRRQAPGSFTLPYLLEAAKTTETPFYTAQTAPEFHTLFLAAYRCYAASIGQLRSLIVDKAEWDKTNAKRRRIELIVIFGRLLHTLMYSHTFNCYLRTMISLNLPLPDPTLHGEYRQWAKVMAIPYKDALPVVLPKTKVNTDNVTASTVAPPTATNEAGTSPTSTSEAGTSPTYSPIDINTGESSIDAGNTSMSAINAADAGAPPINTENSVAFPASPPVATGNGGEDAQNQTVPLSPEDDNEVEEEETPLPKNTAMMSANEKFAVLQSWIRLPIKHMVAQRALERACRDPEVRDKSFEITLVGVQPSKLEHMPAWNSFKAVIQSVFRPPTVADEVTRLLESRIRSLGQPGPYAQKLHTRFLSLINNDLPHANLGIHCEAALAVFAAHLNSTGHGGPENDLEFQLEDVAVSKLCCPACWELFEILKAKNPGSYKVRGRHSTVYPVELPLLLNDEVVEEMVKRFEGHLRAEGQKMINNEQMMNEAMERMAMSMKRDRTMSSQSASSDISNKSDGAPSALVQNDLQPYPDDDDI
jgi:hypothetical protein